jgi:sugar phosphate isomerase/epimerase
VVRSRTYHQFLDSAAFIAEFGDKVFHAHVKDFELRLDDVDFEAMIRALNRVGYQGPLSIEWDDSGIDRDWGAPDAIAFVLRTDFSPSQVAFDAAFAKET